MWRNTLWIGALAIAGLGVGSACKGKGEAGKGSGSAAASTDPVFARAMPKVDKPDLLATVTDMDTVPLIVYVAVDGKITVAPGPGKWAKLPPYDPKGDRLPYDLEVLGMQAREAVMLGKSPRDTVMESAKNPGKAVDVDLATLEDTRTRATADDDPPPPEEEEEEKPDDESGGTGTAMMLEEGKMGKKDSDRAEGQYKMKRNDVDPQLARQQAIDQARNAGILAGARKGGGAFASLGEPGDSGRQTSTSGVVTPAVHPKLPVVIAADPKARAKATIKAIEHTNGSLLVAAGDDVRPLKIQFFDPERRRYSGGDFDDAWIEVRAVGGELQVEGVASEATKLKWDLAELAKAYKAVKAQPRFSAAGVDILVGEDIDTQQLVELMVALHRAGADQIGLGSVPSADSDYWKARGKQPPSMFMGSPASQGDLDKAIIRRFVKQAQPQIFACYEAQLKVAPGLSGTVMTSFLITGSGNVQTASGSGVDPTLATCVASVIKGIEFPKPKNGGNVQVNFPFTFRLGT